MTAEIVKALREPFAAHELGIRPGATNKDNTKALVLCYIPSWALRKRLTDVAPGWQWSVREAASENGTAAHGTLEVCGVSRSDFGEARVVHDDDEIVKSASTDVFKRACRQFEMGWQLEVMPKLWWPYNENLKQHEDQPQLRIKAHALMVATHHAGGDPTRIEIRKFLHEPQGEKSGGQAGGAKKADPPATREARNNLAKLLSEAFGGNAAAKADYMSNVLCKTVAFQDLTGRQVAQLQDALIKRKRAEELRRRTGG